MWTGLKPMLHYRPMKAWLKALLAQTWFALWAILSIISTLSTFFVPSWKGYLTILFGISAIVAFGWANFRVFRKQQRELASLRESVTHLQARGSSLRIVEEPRSRYMLSPINDVPRADFQGGYVEFYLMIENAGRRNSIVTGYQIEIVDLGKTYPGLRPIENKTMVPGRHSRFGVDSAHGLSKTGNIHIPAETATDRGSLLFQIPDLSLEQFANAGLRMTGSERRFGPLRCRLTLTDTTGSSVTHEFTATEA
jgi:hypothetical protein